MTSNPARILLPALLLAALALTGCSGGGAEDSDAGGSDSRSTVSEVAPNAGLADQDASSTLSATRYNKPAETVIQDQALIRKGNVALRADDVARAQIEVQKVVDKHAGQVTDERTESDDKGRARFSRMVIRVPSADFRATVDGLKEVGELESATTNQDDVTSEVIDVKTRLGVQKRSIARISVLFSQAQSIRDIMAIESELSQRQADLEALKQQAAYLANQTSLSTIVVSIDQIPAKRTAPKDEDTGFLAGLSAGWGALSSFAVGLATVAGAVLPWLVVIAVVGFPTLLLVRSLRRRTASTGATSEPAAPTD